MSGVVTVAEHETTYFTDSFQHLYILLASPAVDDDIPVDTILLKVFSPHLPLLAPATMPLPVVLCQGTCTM